MLCYGRFCFVQLSYAKSSYLKEKDYENIQSEDYRGGTVKNESVCTGDGYEHEEV